MDEQFVLDKEVLARTPPEVIAVLMTMAARIATLEAELAELKEKLNKSSSNSSRPPLSDLPREQHKRKPPKQPSVRD